MAKKTSTATTNEAPTAKLAMMATKRLGNQRPTNALISTPISGKRGINQT